MNFFKKIFTNYSESKKNEEIKEQEVSLSLDDAFVHNFINKGGKFLYCTKMDEVIINIKNIISENNWNTLICSDIDLLKILKKVDVTVKEQFSNTSPFFTSCEHLIANEGSIMFTSNQIGSSKYKSFSDDFIVYATTSQIVKNTGEGLTSIKKRFQGNLPSNIGAIRNYKINSVEDDIDYSNANSKNLYLLLFEDF